MIIGYRPLFLALVASAIVSLGVSAARAMPPDIAFDVFRNGKKIGTHTVNFEQRQNDLRVSIAIDLTVRIAFVPVYRYTHRNVELWQDDRLISLRTETNDNGTELSVVGFAEGDKFVVDGSNGRIELPGAIAPTSYWNPATISRSNWLDTQYGRIVDVDVALRRCADFSSHRNYDVSGDLNLCLGYRHDGVWDNLSFTLGGDLFAYQSKLVGTADLVRQ